MKDLKNDIKQQCFKPVYLLYGEERFLVEHYANALGNAMLPDNALMNRDTFDGKDISVDRIIDAANTLPFLSERRVVYVRDSKLFAAGRKNDSEAMAGYLSQIPGTTAVIFVETEVDKRGRLYKQTAATGRAVELTHPPQSDLLKWVQNIFSKNGKKISVDAGNYLLRTVSHQMTAVRAEAEKLTAHAGERNDITAADIDAVCSPGMEARIFDLVGAVAGGNGAKAIRLYRNMLLLKESPLMVLTMMARQFRLILQCTAAKAKKMPAAEISRVLGLRGFVVDEALRQGKLLDSETLIFALKDCLDMDIRIKTGLMGAEPGVEVLIAKYANVND
jgi:DNA polymerase-3 subunit delta